MPKYLQLRRFVVQVEIYQIYSTFWLDVGNRTLQNAPFSRHLVVNYGRGVILPQYREQSYSTSGGVEDEYHH